MSHFITAHPVYSALIVIAVAIALVLLFDLIETMHEIRDELQGARHQRALENAERQGRVFTVEPHQHAHGAAHHPVPRG